MMYVKICLPDGNVEDSRLQLSDVDPYWITLDDLDGTRRRFEATDLFEALIAARRSFEERGCRLLCAGARRDV
jgi:hypothetical protein